MDEVFGSENFVSLIVFSKTSSFSASLMDSIADFVLWYGKDKNVTRFRRLQRTKEPGADGGTKYTSLQLYDGSQRPMISDEKISLDALSEGAKVFRVDNLVSQGFVESSSQPYKFQDREFPIASNLHWKTTMMGMGRLARAERIVQTSNTLGYIRHLDDFPVFPVNNVWTDIGGIQSRSDSKVYVVQTAPRVIERCLLMTTDPGDLVLDPTCGSGTTAYIAEQWGRRWITIDTSRVAIAIARQRLLTAKFDYYQLRDVSQGVTGGFRYKTVPHSSLRSIAQNTYLDPIFAKHEPILDTRLAACNAALEKVDDSLRSKLQSKLLLKQRSDGRKAMTEADRRRWELPRKGGQWQHWQVPFNTDPDYPPDLGEAISAYRQAWRAKMDEVNACIAANAEQEELVDQPEISKGIVRVSGPFTVEAVQPAEISLGAVIPERDTSPIGGAPGKRSRGKLI